MGSANHNIACMLFLEWVSIQSVSERYQIIFDRFLVCLQHKKVFFKGKYFFGEDFFLVFHIKGHMCLKIHSMSKLEISLQFLLGKLRFEIHGLSQFFQ